jgi:hypothetical protein
MSIAIKHPVIFFVEYPATIGLILGMADMENQIPTEKDFTNISLTINVIAINSHIKNTKIRLMLNRKTGVLQDAIFNI